MKSIGNGIVTALLVGLLTAPMASARDLEKGEWYVRLTVASDTGLEDRGNIVGQLNDALLSADQYDLRELRAAFIPFLSIVFFHPQWGLEVVDYTSDYHPISAIGPVPGCGLESETELGDEWTFEVRSDDAWRDLTLSWEGLQADMERMVLVDLETGERLPASIEGVLQTYSFNMNGFTVRPFQWELLSENTKDKGMTASGKALRSAASEDGTGKAGSTWQPGGWSHGQDEAATHRQPPGPSLD